MECNASEVAKTEIWPLSPYWEKPFAQPGSQLSENQPDMVRGIRYTAFAGFSGPDTIH